MVCRALSLLRRASIACPRALAGVDGPACRQQFRLASSSSSRSTRQPRQILGVGLDCTEDEVKAAFRELAKRVHPDTKPGEDREAATCQFQVIEEAYKALLAELRGEKPSSAAHGGSDAGMGRQHPERPAWADSSWSKDKEAAQNAAGARLAVGFDPAELRRAALMYGAPLGLAALIARSYGQEADRVQELQNQAEYGMKQSRLRQEVAEKEQRELEQQLARKAGRGRSAPWKTTIDLPVADVENCVAGPAAEQPTTQ